MRPRRSPNEAPVCTMLRSWREEETFAIEEALETQYPERTFDFEATYNLAMSFGGGANRQVAHSY